MAHDLREPSSPPTSSKSPTPDHVGASPPPSRAQPETTPLSNAELHQEAVPPPGWAVVWRWLQANTFVPGWLPRRWRHPIAVYLLAVVVQLGVAMITRLLIQFVPTYAFPGVLEILAVALVAMSWGAGPGVFAALVGLALEETVVLPTLSGEGQLTGGDLIEGVLFMAVGICLSLVATTTERARRRAVEEKAHAEAREAHAREAALRQTQEHMDEFIAIACHDIRSPLSAALGFNEIATVRYERLAAAVLDVRPELEYQIETVRHTLGEARESVERMWRLVDVLFDTAQMRAGTIELQRVPCDLVALVYDQVVALRVANPRRTLDLQVAGEGSVLVRADANRIGQVVANYVTNALKYSPADQPVAVRVARNGTWACVAVEDHGPGLPASEQEAIWGRFYRVTGVRPQGGAGTTRLGLGLGLHISKVIIEGHGGQVGVKSGVGKGSTFWFTLQLADKH